MHSFAIIRHINAVEYAQYIFSIQISCSIYFPTNSCILSCYMNFFFRRFALVDCKSVEPLLKGMACLEPIVFNTTMRNNRAAFLRSLLDNNTIGASSFLSNTATWLPCACLIEQGKLVPWGFKVFYAQFSLFLFGFGNPAYIFPPAAV